MNGGSAVWLATPLLMLGLSACDPIEMGRSLSGINKNDPDPATAPYSTNLATAEQGGYPNLASVPPPPIVSTTLAERQKLAANLTGQRISTEANDVRGQPGAPASGPVPPPPEIPPSLAAPQIAAIPPPTPKPETPIPPMRAMNEPPPPAPLETPMQTPQIANVPGVEASRPAPGQGRVSAIPSPAPSALPAPTVQSGNPQPTPPQATLPEPKLSPQAAAMPTPKLPPAPTTIVGVDLPVGATALPADVKSRVAEMAGLYKENPRTVRVVAYAAPGVGGAEQLNAFRTALDRAQLVANELSAAGVPKKQIQAEAAPASASVPAGRIEIQLMQ